MRSDAAAVVAAFEAATKLSREIGFEHDFIGPLSNWLIASDQPNSKTIEWFNTVAAGHHATVDEHRAEAWAMAGRFDEARAFLDSELRIAESLLPTAVGGILGFAGARIEYWAGDIPKAVELGERGTKMLIETGQVGVASTSAGLLARAYFEAGDFDQAATWVKRAEEIGAPDDKLTNLIVTSVKGLLAAQRGDAPRAVQILKDNVALAETTHSPILLGDLTLDLALAYEILGDRTNAKLTYQKALAFYEAKENLVMAARTRAKLAALDESSAQP